VQAASLREKWDQEDLLRQQTAYGIAAAGTGADGEGDEGAAAAAAATAAAQLQLMSDLSEAAEAAAFGVADIDEGESTGAAAAAATADALDDLRLSGPGAAGLLDDVAEEGGGAGGGGESKAAKLLALLTEQLPESVNKQKADEFSASFCYYATKNARKRLVQNLVRVPRFRADLTVTYARIAASLSRLYADIMPALLDALRKEFFGMLKTKNQQQIEGKLKTVRYLGELVKFHKAPPIVAFKMFRTLLSDFSNQNAQLLAVLLETCGRYLYLLPYTREKMNETLASMMRLRRARNLDITQQTMLEAAYFAVKPPERVARSLKPPLSPVQQYAKYLLMVKLDESRVSVEAVIKALRRLPWSDPQENIALHLVKAALKVARTKQTNLANLADCLSGLASYQPNVVVQLVDRLLEDVQRSMETPYKREVQRALGLVRLLGELYNFTAVSSQLILDFLYHVINFDHAVGRAEATNTTATTATAAAAAVASNNSTTAGSAWNSTGTGTGFGTGTGTGSAAGPVGAFTAILTDYAGAAAAALALPTPPANSAAPSLSAALGKVKYDPRTPSEVDPVTDLFRAQLVCELLNTSGMYFVHGVARQKLSRFLTYFQRYLLTKQFIPLHVEFSILDCFDSLEEQAQEAAAESQRKKGPKGAAAAAAAAAAVGAPSGCSASGTIFVRYDSLEAVQAEIDVLESVPEEERLRLERESEAAEAAEAEAEAQAAAAAAEAAAAAATAAREAANARRGVRGGGEEEDDESESGDSDSESGSSSGGDGSESDSGDSESGSGSSGSGSSDDSDDSDDEDDEEEEEEEEDEEEDEEELEAARKREEEEAERRAAIAMEKLRQASEDDEFEKAFKHVMQESVHGVSTKGNDVNKMVIPGTF
jgi:hypothetical protein